MSIQKFMRQFLVLAGFAVLASHILPAKELSFSYQPPLAGKACLAEDGFKVKRTLATVALAPEFQLPIELVYSSCSESACGFGYGWHSPQLESSLKWDTDGLLWNAPWGEKLKFYPKKHQHPKNALKLAPVEDARKGRGLFAPYTDWEADSSDSDYAKRSLVFSIILVAREL